MFFVPSQLISGKLHRHKWKLKEILDVTSEAQNFDKYSCRRQNVVKQPGKKGKNQKQMQKPEADPLLKNNKKMFVLEKKRKIRVNNEKL